MALRCPGCGATLSSSARSCGVCGKQVDPAQRIRELDEELTRNLSAKADVDVAVPTYSREEPIFTRPNHPPTRAPIPTTNRRARAVGGRSTALFVIGSILLVAALVLHLSLSSKERDDANKAEVSKLFWRAAGESGTPSDGKPEREDRTFVLLLAGVGGISILPGIVTMGSGRASETNR